MDDSSSMLLKPTLHVEVCVPLMAPPGLRGAVRDHLLSCYRQLCVGSDIWGYEEEDERLKAVISIEIADYTGPNTTDLYSLNEVELDVQTYTLKTEDGVKGRRFTVQEDEAGSGLPPVRALNLPNVALKDEWNSLVFEDGLPSRLLRYITRMVSMMKTPGLNLASFNWNRLCLLHGPPGSGKSTLCRAIAQKLSIRLGDAFPRAMLLEINTNALLSKFFGESGKLIGATFDNVRTQAQDQSALICVVMDEVETIAGSREKSTNGGECKDGMRATNQLLTALDRLRALPNVIVLCTSNLLASIDNAFLDRVDIKQLIPSPSPQAIYDILRSCLNELVRSNLIDMVAVVAAAPALPAPSTSSQTTRSSTKTSPDRKRTRSSSSAIKPVRSLSPTPPSSEPWTRLTAPQIPPFSEMIMTQLTTKQPDAAQYRVWAIAQKCEGFSGRTLRRLPILGLAMYTWGGSCTLDGAVLVLEAAVDQELTVKAARSVGVMID